MLNIRWATAADSPGERRGSCWFTPAVRSAAVKPVAGQTKISWVKSVREATEIRLPTSSRALLFRGNFWIKRELCEQPASILLRFLLPLQPVILRLLPFLVMPHVFYEKGGVRRSAPLAGRVLVSYRCNVKKSFLSRSFEVAAG
jgi:hypothetical protein